MGCYKHSFRTWRMILAIAFMLSIRWLVVVQSIPNQSAPSIGSLSDFFNQTFFSTESSSFNRDRRSTLPNENNNDDNFSPLSSPCVAHTFEGGIHCLGLTTLKSVIKTSKKFNDSNDIQSIEITSSDLRIIDLNEFNGFKNLQRIAMSHCNLTSIKGSIPNHVKVLNLTSNPLTSLENSVFIASKNGTTSGIQTVDLTFTKISSLPDSLLNATTIQEIYIKGNHFQYEFVWTKLWHLFSKFKGDAIKLLSDADESFCQHGDANLFHNQYTVLGVLKARQDMKDACDNLNKTSCHSCTLYGLQRDVPEGYPISHKSRYGSISISLQIDCSNGKLEKLPRIPIQTWLLNVSNNRIKDLSRLKEKEYQNLIILLADDNEIDIETLSDTPFLEKFSGLGLRNNGIRKIPPHILESMKIVRGQGFTNLGDNYLDCDCDTLKEVKPLLIVNSNKIKDTREIYCDGKIEPNSGKVMSLINVKFGDLCHMDNGEAEHWIVIVISIEAILIILIICKVWYDQKIFRKTGTLPWFSAKMPRLPCDTMLEGVKDHGYSSNPSLRCSNKRASTSASSSNDESTHHLTWQKYICFSSQRPSNALSSSSYNTSGYTSALGSRSSSVPCAVSAV